MKRSIALVALALACTSARAHPVVHGPPTPSTASRVVLRTPTPLQLPRVVTAGDGWGLVWSHADTPPTLEVRVARLDADLTAGPSQTASPRDEHSSAFAAVAPRDADLWGAVYTDDVSAPHRAQHGRFARVDLAAHHTEASPLRALDPAQPAGAAVLAWSPQLSRWGVLALDRALSFYTVDARGDASDPVAPFDGAVASPVTDATPLIADGARWAAVLRGREALRVVRFETSCVEPVSIEVAPVPMRAVTGASLDRDDAGLGVAWSTEHDGLWFARVEGDRVRGAPVQVSANHNTHDPALAWNGRHHVLAWAETDTGHTVRAAVLDARGVALRTITLAEGSGDEDFVSGTTAAARGDGSGAVAVLWQRGQTTVEGAVLAP